jgi:predicted GIY-YIG superfamily endonuclease
LKLFFVYLLRCADGSCYLGQTDGMDARLQQQPERLGGALPMGEAP